MTAPLVVIGLDAFDPDLARRWASSGDLPTLAQLLRSGAQAPVANPFGLFVGALWPSFASGLRPDRTRYHCWDEIDPATYRWRLTPPKPQHYEPFWSRIAAAGARVAAVDVPHARARPGGPATELFEWGCHDRHYGLHSAPGPLAGEIAAAFGFHPVLGLQPWRERHFSPDDLFARKGRRYRRPIEEGRLTRAMVAGVAAKGAMLRALLARQPWDLFVAVFGESHAVGHQQWHLHDPAHPRFDAEARAAAGGDPVLQVYRAIDAELGRLLAALPADATVMVHLSHGMTAHHDGTHLLDELLARLDRGGPGTLRLASKPLLPVLQHAAALAGLPAGLGSAIGQALRGDGAAARARRRFFAAPNNSVYGGIRFNLAGREPQGRVRPDELDGLVAELERELLGLTNAATGGPVVLALHRCEGHYRRAPDDTMPDLFVEWERSAPIETVTSPSIGTLRTRYTHWRTGDHKPDGLLIARGAGLGAGAAVPGLAVEDFAPSIAARLGMDLPGVDGRAVPWLAQAPPVSRGFAPAPATAARRR
ncbi:MAG TPA: alkaline phosphatase family protein [Allosphingosinicella sp.]|jgi:predicted AlkP superfamily phosphohydrolase/phosphomutase